jgi:hypothetical protein
LASCEGLEVGERDQLVWHTPWCTCTCASGYYVYDCRLGIGGLLG